MIKIKLMIEIIQRYLDITVLEILFMKIILLIHQKIIIKILMRIKILII